MQAVYFGGYGGAPMGAPGMIPHFGMGPPFLMPGGFGFGPPPGFFMQPPPGAGFPGPRGPAGVPGGDPQHQQQRAGAAAADQHGGQQQQQQGLRQRQGALVIGALACRHHEVLSVREAATVGHLLSR